MKNKEFSKFQFWVNEGIENVLVFVALVVFFVIWSMNINYLEYDCVREGNTPERKVNIKIFKEHLVEQYLYIDGREELFSAYECKLKEDSDYYSLRFCGRDFVTIDKRNNTYTLRDRDIDKKDTYLADYESGFCKKKSIFTRLFNSFDSFSRKKNFTVDY